MKRFCLFAAATAAALTLVSASPPGSDGAGTAPGDYPRCSRDVNDRCIQREGRVSEPESRALDAMPQEGSAPVARGGPYEPPPAGAVARRKHYPRCSATVRDSCIQGGARHVRHTRRVRRAGERG
jgi:hypothetical protein